MKYLDGAPQDAETMRILECPRCKNDEFGKDAFHCRICGLSLYNLCVGENEYNQQHKNPSNARFCETCGCETNFFREGILKSWQELQGISNDRSDEHSDGNIANGLNVIVPDDELPF